MLDVDDGQDAGDGLAEIVDAVELGAGGGDLLDAQLAQLSLELTELLDQLVLVFGPQGTGLNLGGRL